MHPSGVQFGLSRACLQLRGEEVLLSDQLLETISVEAQRHFQRGGPPIRGNFLVDITVRAAQDVVGTQNPGLQQETVSKEVSTDSRASARPYQARISEP
jgi:hypothetical protein